MITFLIILCLAVVALFVFVAHKTRPTGSGTLSAPKKFKWPAWITWQRALVTAGLLFLGSCSMSIWSDFFPEAEERTYIARAEIGDAGMLIYSIPPIGPDYQNLIVFDGPMGYRFAKDARPAINFPRAKLLQFNERSGGAGARWISGFLFGSKRKVPLSVFEGSIRGRQPGLPANVMLIRAGSELHFRSRGEHTIWVPPGATLGDVTYIRYRLKLVEKEKK